MDNNNIVTLLKVPKNCVISYFISLQVFSDNDFAVHKGVKAPPSEKPPPVPPPIDSHSSNMDDELDKQEQAIIASLEMEEREHKRYMETQEKMRSKCPLFRFSIHMNFPD